MDQSLNKPSGQAAGQSRASGAPDSKNPQASASASTSTPAAAATPGLTPSPTPEQGQSTSSGKKDKEVRPTTKTNTLKGVVERLKGESIAKAKDATSNAGGTSSADASPGPVEGSTEAAQPATTSTPKSAASIDLLRKRPGNPFIIRTFKHEADGASRSTGSILSQSLDKLLATSAQSDAGALTLAAFRKLVPQMSRFPGLEKFCTPSGTHVDDESIALTEYLALEDELPPEGTSGGIPSFKLHFSSTKLGASAGLGADGQAGNTYAAPNLAEGPSVKADKTAEHGGLLSKSEPLASLITVESASTGAEGKSAGTLTENEWAVVLRNCSVFYGWIIDPVSKRIKRAPKPAFRLRSKVDQTAVSKIPDFKINTESVATVGTSKEELFVTAGVGDVAAVAGAGASVDDSKASIENLTIQGLEAVSPKTESGIPNFRVNDDSRIEITAHQDEFTVSMAKSDFSEQSTEVSVSGGGWGFSASASAGYASSSSNNSKSLSSNSSSTLIARYMFPRCDLLLWPDELEPTPELAGLIEQIRTTKNIKVLRKLQAEYGQLFCQRVTLGGRLLSTKFVTSSEKKSLEEHKESFKLAVGVSASGSFAGFSASASMKHEQAQGSTNTAETSQAQKQESVAFEAVGGDTILASNPPSWSATVANSANWRVIDRDALTPMTEFLSALPGYEAVQSWFVQAVPALHRYMRLDEAHSCKIRLRVMSPSNSLSIPNVGDNASFYLGHDVERAITPRLCGVNPESINAFWVRLGVSYDVPIFIPQSYRAPSILGYEKFDVNGVPYAAAFNSAFTKTEWTIIAPFDTELCHGTRVILQTTNLVDNTSNQPKADGLFTAPNVSHMTVFRNAQGEFLPAMSDSDEYQYWRLIKFDTNEKYIKPGDEVRLVWDFNDQTTGWRDFTQDTFGRRQMGPPPGYASKNPLFIKVPWPRFEAAGNPTALVMSSDKADLATKGIIVKNRDKFETMKYCLQDLRLRIDKVTNNGRGDADDYLLSKLKMEGEVQRTVSMTWQSNGKPLQMKSEIFWLGIRS